MYCMLVYCNDFTLLYMPIDGWACSLLLKLCCLSVICHHFMLCNISSSCVVDISSIKDQLSIPGHCYISGDFTEL